MKPLEAETLLAFGRSMDTGNLLSFLKCGKLKNLILRVFLQKKRILIGCSLLLLTVN